ncbi:hypothetical protein [Singulisphaera sp. GP187]|uniref:hypothetical protein n=1 Tax=Singulisphaera sp. GP187 TaxID=1882752 RepID=UPI0011612C27|nr:hypothetical protein [Singulisphaera sp. GP187]
MGDDVEWPGQPGTIPTEDIVRRYTPPREWPLAGTLLRVPQVVWLGYSLPYWNNAYNFTFLERRYGLGIHRYDNAGCGYVVTGEGYGPHGAAHPEAAERERLKEAFAAAKSHIESIRAGRTWVKVVDWLDTDNTGTGGYVMSSNFPHLSAPTLGSGPFGTNAGYLGSDFLHIFAGSIIEDTAGFIRLVKFAFGDLTSDTAHRNSVERVKDAIPKFRGYRAMLYSTNLDAVKEIVPAYEFTFSGIVIHNPGDQYWDVTEAPYPDDFNYCIVNIDAVLDTSASGSGPPTVRQLAEAQAAGLTTTRNNDINGYMVTDTTVHFAATLSSMEHSVSAFNWSGSDPNPVSIEGTTSDLTAESLIALIAAHYGFDPGTGRDIG